MNLIVPFEMAYQQTKALYPSICDCPQLVSLQDLRLGTNYRLIQKYGQFLSLWLPQVNHRLDDADETWLLVQDQSEIRAHLSLWYTNTPRLNGKSTGYIGHYAAVDDLAADAILKHAEAVLRRRNCEIAIGPVDGNTWRQYRFVTESTDHGRFLMEVVNPSAYPKQFLWGGFRTLATYKSTLLNLQDYSACDTRAGAVSDCASGLNIRSLRSGNMNEELETMFDISCSAFQKNFLYSPISKIEFLERYRSALPFVEPELVFIAEKNGNACGFLFAVPQPSRAPGYQADTIVVKTLARLPGAEFAGVGACLVRHCHAEAAKRGFSKAIHALYKEDNNSSRFSRVPGAIDIRTYALFSKDLAISGQG